MMTYGAHIHVYPKTGHHAQDDIAMGYCFFNNVAVAAASALVKYPSLIKRVLILDWYVVIGCPRYPVAMDTDLFLQLGTYSAYCFLPFNVPLYALIDIDATFFL